MSESFSREMIVLHLDDELRPFSAAIAVVSASDSSLPAFGLGSRYANDGPMGPLGRLDQIYRIAVTAWND